MTKCNICENKIEELFLGKILGTYVKKGGKINTVCNNCQKRFKNEIFEKLRPS